MKLSIFTPTNNPVRIDLPYNSIISQLTADNTLDVEWVIVPNSNVEIPEYITKHTFVKIFRCPNDLKTIGGLKKFACDKATGDVFIELDHDDELLPGSLKIIRDSLAGKEKAFLFSDAVYIKSNKTSPAFAKDCGWEYYTFEGHTINKTFEVSARSLSEIYWAPDHVRVWTRKAYYAAGGHNVNLFVADDHELLIKTYIAGAEFIQVPYPLYRYYLHDSNTWVKNVDAVTEQQEKNRDLHQRALIKEWCSRLELPYIKWDATKKYTCKDNSVGCVVLDDVLTTVPPGKSIIDLMNTIYTALAPGGWLLVDVPSTDGKGAFCDPTHVSFWNDLSFRYYTNANAAKFVPGLKCRYQQVILKTDYPSDWHKKNNVSYVRSDMCALKGQRQPGRVHI